jgi:cytochrome oxidase Cu insertion factor (SCO1/SenC/PrrC family)
MTRHYVLAAAVAVLVVGAGAVVGLALTGSSESGGAYRGSKVPSGESLPRFLLRDHRGTVVRGNALAGKVVVLTFLETKCREACPFIAGQIGIAFRRMSPPQREGVIAVAISTHPRDDTPATARAFLRRERAERFIRYLVGSEKELRPVWRAFQILPAFDTGDADVHSAPVRIYDRHSRWVTTLHAGIDLTPANLIHDVTVAKES